MTTRNKRVRFGDNNFATSATITVASEKTNFELANLTTLQRSQVYRPQGNFTIDSSNNSLYINDGSDKTVTLSSADYAGGAALATQVQTQLNASSSNWTCTYSTSTGKFTISRSSGTDTLRFTQTSNAVWDTMGYTTASDTSAATAGTADERRNHTSEHITLDLGAAFDVQEFHAIGPLGDVFSLSSSGTYTLYGNTADSWASPALTVSLTRGQGGIHHYLDGETGSTEYRYWRFEFQDRENTAGPESFKIGHLYLGDYATVTTTNVATGFTKGYLDPSNKFVSDSGAEYYRSRTRRREFRGMVVGQIAASERRDLELMFETLGVETPFYFSFDPTTAIADNLSEVTMYGRFTRPPDFRNVVRDYYSMLLDITEAV